MAGYLALIEAMLGELAGEELDLVSERRVAVENDKVLFLEPASAALSAVADFSMKFLRSHLYVKFGGKFDKLL